MYGLTLFIPMLGEIGQEPETFHVEVLEAEAERRRLGPNAVVAILGIDPSLPSVATQNVAREGSFVGISAVLWLWVNYSVLLNENGLQFLHVHLSHTPRFNRHLGGAARGLAGAHAGGVDA